MTTPARRPRIRCRRRDFHQAARATSSSSSTSTMLRDHICSRGTVVRLRRADQRSSSSRYRSRVAFMSPASRGLMAPSLAPPVPDGGSVTVARRAPRPGVSMRSCSGAMDTNPETAEDRCAMCKGEMLSILYYGADGESVGGHRICPGCGPADPVPSRARRGLDRGLSPHALPGAQGLR